MMRDGAEPPRLRRLFVAVFPPAGVQADVHAACAALRESPAGREVGWVREASLHLTLRFLGDCDDEAASAAASAMHEAAASHAAFEIALGAFGAFPETRRARVLWVGIAQGSEALGALAAALEAALGRRGVPREPRPFVPHLTLGRLRGPADWSDALAGAPPPESRFRVSGLALVRSSLAAGGSRYDRAAEARLGG